MVPEKKVGLFAFLMEMIGVRNKALSETLERIKDADRKMEEIEQVTMSWTVDELSERERTEAGFSDR